MRVSDEDRTHWKNWLRINLENTYIANRRLGSWKELNSIERSRDDYLASLIAKYYYTLSPEMQLAFRTGLVDCLFEIPEYSRYIDVFVTLLELAVAIDCAEVIKSDVLEKKVTRGGFSNIKEIYDSDGDHAITSALIKVLLHFASCGDRHKYISLCTSAISSNMIEKTDIYSLFLCLCIANPNDLLRNWKIVRDVHKEISTIDGYDTADVTHPVIALDLNDYIEVQELADFQIKIAKLKDYSITDEWLCINLLKNEDLDYQVEYVPNKSKISIYKESLKSNRLELVEKVNYNCSEKFKTFISKNSSLSSGFIDQIREKVKELHSMHYVKLLNVKTVNENKPDSAIIEELNPFFSKKEEGVIS